MSQEDLFESQWGIVPLGPHPDGATYNPELDHRRLAGQNLRVFNALQDGEWKTLRELSEDTGDPEASISARLRDLRKKKFGAHTVESRRRGEPKQGLWEYKLEVKNGRDNT